MKASRAPGPIQSYSIQHSKRSNGGVSGGDSNVSKSKNSSVLERKGNKTVPVEVNQGVLKQFRNLDDIPDIDDVAWGAVPSSSAKNGQSPRSANAHLSGYTGSQFSPHWSTIDQEDHQSSYQSNYGQSHNNYSTMGQQNGTSSSAYGQTTNYSSSSYAQQYQAQHATDADEVEDEYQDLGYGAMEPPTASAYAYHDDDHAVDSDSDEVQEYSSPNKPTSAKELNRGGNASSSSRQKPVTVVMKKSGPPSAVKVIAKPAAKPTPKLVPPSQAYSHSPNSPVGNKLAINPQAPPLPCESPGMGQADDSKSKATEPSGGGSLYFSKQPRAVEYKPYTLKDYNLIRPKEYIEIAKMQPDLQTEELVAKRKNLDRIKDFSKQLRVVNQETIANQRKLPSATEQSDLQRAKQKYTSSRFRALEFAKHVPKPNAKDGSTSPCSDPRDGKLSDSEEEDRVDGLTASLGNTRFSQSADGKRTIGRPKKTIRHDTSQASGGNAASLRKGDHQPAASSEAAARLAELEALHLQKKAQVEAIRRTFRR